LLIFFLIFEDDSKLKVIIKVSRCTIMEIGNINFGKKWRKNLDFI